jgi:hypothetical protein
VHEDHLRNSSEIQKLSLEDQPEFKGAEFFRNAESTELLLMIEYTDYLPKDECAVSIEFKQNGKAIMKQISTKDISLVSTNSGLVKQCAIEIPAEIDITSAFESSIMIKNAFGRQCTAVKSWRGL